MIRGRQCSGLLRYGKLTTSRDSGIVRVSGFVTFESTGNTIPLIEKSSISYMFAEVRLSSVMLSKTKGSEVVSNVEGRSLI